MVDGLFQRPLVHSQVAHLEAGFVVVGLRCFQMSAPFSEDFDHEVVPLDNGCFGGWFGPGVSLFHRL
jgi:hypothetical protein